MTDKAWQTYVDEAREHLNKAGDLRQHSATLGAGSVEAQIGLGWALLALVELQQPQDDAVTEVGTVWNNRTVWDQFDRLVEMQAEYDRLKPHVGKEVALDGEHLCILTSIHKEDVENGVVWAVLVSCTAAVGDQTVPSDRVQMVDRRRVRALPACSSCKQATGSYHLSTCPYGVAVAHRTSALDMS